MEENKTGNRIHPLVAGAAVSVMLVSLVGVAAITGLIPNSHSTAASATSFAPSNAPAIATAATSPAALVDAEEQPKVAAADIGEPSPKPTTQKPAQTHFRPAQRSAPVAQAPRICDSCGQVESIQALKQEAQPSGVGMVAGAVVGGLLGNQVGGGNGRKIATVAGAVGGGYAGNEVEKHTRATTSYQVRVRMENGSIRTFPYTAQPGWNIGDRVRIVNGQLTARA